MPKKSNKQRSGTNGSTNNIKAKSGKDLALGLTGQLGSGLIKGLVPVLVGAIGAAVAKGMKFNTSGNYAIASPMGQGSGALPVSIPAANGTIVRSGKPNMRSSANGNCTIKHREYVADVFAQQEGFDLQFQFGVNPGNSSLFPWLSTVAQRFEMYKFRSLRVIYEPQSSTTTTGTVMLAIDYDASDPPPVSKTQMMSYKRAVRSPPWFACTHDSASADLHRLKTNYVLAGTAPAGTDIKTYDIGNLFVALQTDQPSGTVCGELYVEYDVDLLTPQITNDVLSYSLYNGGVTTASMPFGGNPVPFGSLPVIVRDASPTLNAQNIQIQVAGYYQVTALSADLQQGIDITNNAATCNIISASIVFNAAPAVASIYTLYIQVTDTSAYHLTFTVAGGAGNIGTDVSDCLTITPFAANCVPNQDFTSIQEPPTPLRARLGRIH